MVRLAFSIVFATFAFAGTSAHAQPAPQAEAPPWQERFSVGLGAHLANSDSAWLHLAFMGEVGVRAPGVPAPFLIRGRGFFSIGGTTEQSDWEGNYKLYGVGIEGLACTGGQWLCGVVGIDIGYQSADLTDVNNDRFEGSRSGPVVGPRFGIEAGLNRVRFRFMIDRYRWKTHHDPSEWMSNGGVTFGAGARF